MRRFLAPLALALLFIGGCQGTAPKSAEADHDEHAGHDHGSEEAGHEGHDHGADAVEDHATHEGEPVRLTVEQAEIAGIEVEEVKLVQVKEGLTAPGVISVISGRTAAVTPSADGVLAELNVAVGQRVVQGQTIGAIESSGLAEAFSRITEAEQALAEARARVKDDESQVKLAASKVASSEQTLKRQKELASTGAFSQAPLQAAQSSLRDAESELLSLQKEEASHSDQLKRLESLFKEGLIGRLELDAAKLEVQQDVIKLERARANVAMAKAALKREESIAAKGLLTSREVQSAEGDLRTSRLELERAKGQVTSSRARLRIAEKSLTNARSHYRSVSNGTGVSGGRALLKAPMTGVITQLDAAKGEAVDRTQKLIVVEDFREVWATVSIADKDAHQLKVGMQAQIASKTLGGASFSGPVSVIGSRLDLKTRTLPVQVLLDNSSGDLKPGMFVEARIEQGQAEEALTISTGALLEEDGRTYVFVKEKDGFVRHEVKAGRESGGKVQILSGLHKGDLVASKGTFILKSQAKKDELKGHEH